MPNFRENVELYVRPDMTTSQVLDMLQPSTRSMKSLERVFVHKKVGEYMKPGHYVVKPSSPSVYVVRMLNNGWQTPVQLTLSGSMRQRGEIARKIANQMLVDSASMRSAMLDKSLLEELGVTRATVFSLFIPDTYEIYWTATPEEIMRRMKQVSDAFWTDDNLAKAKKQGLSRMQAVTLASIVNGESRYAPELPRIAGVYLNRLRIGMPLQADPTVAFCFDYKPNRILKKHLECDSPYNTYKHTGLPPGPICCPSRECLEAVLNPDCSEGNLYFCANADFSGTHVFAKSLSEHNANARAFQAELNRRKIKK